MSPPHHEQSWSHVTTDTWRQILTLVIESHYNQSVLMWEWVKRKNTLESWASIPNEASEENYVIRFLSIVLISYSVPREDHTSATLPTLRMCTRIFLSASKLASWRDVLRASGTVQVFHTITLHPTQCVSTVHPWTRQARRKKFIHNLQ